MIIMFVELLPSTKYCCEQIQGRTAVDEASVEMLFTLNKR